MSDPPARTRWPAWRWYAIAAGLLILLALIDMTGVTDSLGP